LTGGRLGWVVLELGVLFLLFLHFVWTAEILFLLVEDLLVLEIGFIFEIFLFIKGLLNLFLFLGE
jgi:hypothetical protein